MSDVSAIKAMFRRVSISFTEIDNGREHIIHLNAPDAGFMPIEISFDEVGELISVTAAPWYDR